MISSWLFWFTLLLVRLIHLFSFKLSFFYLYASSIMGQIKKWVVPLSQNQVDFCDSCLSSRAVLEASVFPYMLHLTSVLHNRPHRKGGKLSDPFQIYFRWIDQYILNTNFEKLQRPLPSFIFSKYWSSFISYIQGKCVMGRRQQAKWLYGAKIKWKVTSQC